MKKYKLKAIDTFDFGSKSFVVGSYPTLEKAIESKKRREKRRSEKEGTTFYRYFITDENGKRLFLEEE